MLPVRLALPLAIALMVRVSSVFLLPLVCESSHQSGLLATSQSPSALRVSVCLCSVLMAQATDGRHTRLVVGSNALEILPATGRLILRDARFRHLKGEVVLGNAVESTRQYMGGLRALADNTANAIAVGKRTAIVSPCSLITDTL